MCAMNAASIGGNRHFFHILAGINNLLALALVER